VEEGARITTGGGRPSGHSTGFFVEPTVFADVDNAMTIAREEIFGPVVSVIPYEDEDHAVRVANDSDYGLAGTVWGADAERAAGVARRLRVGTVGVNHGPVDPGAPFGGFKNSGIGRELGREGLESNFELQSVALGGQNLDVEEA
jgi:betaine-aldehyde dehydrogenase